MKDAKVDRAVRSLTGADVPATSTEDDPIAVARHAERAVEQALRVARGRRFRALHWFGIGDQRS